VIQISFIPELTCNAFLANKPHRLRGDEEESGEEESGEEESGEEESCEEKIKSSLLCFLISAGCVDIWTIISSGFLC
jgi:hypothetical protein